jgi:YgiT-type zinc finger domain-containing protein
MKCALCGAKTAEGKTTVAVETGSGLVVVRSVPARVCEHCGEEWLTDKSAGRVERIVQQARRRNTELEVVALAV